MSAHCGEVRGRFSLEQSDRNNFEGKLGCMRLFMREVPLCIRNHESKIDCKCDISLSEPPVFRCVCLQWDTGEVAQLLWVTDGSVEVSGATRITSDIHEAVDDSPPFKQGSQTGSCFFKEQITCFRFLRKEISLFIIVLSSVWTFRIEWNEVLGRDLLSLLTASTLA